MPVVAPTLADVGALLLSRTVDSDGSELGTFTDDTRPTAASVTNLIGRALTLLAPRLGDPPEGLAGTATSIVALRAAMLVETTHFSRDVESDESVYSLYREELNDTLAAYEAVRAGNAAQQNSPRASSLATKTLLSGL